MGKIGTNISNVLAVVVLLLVAACTSRRTIDMSPDQLQQRIRAGEMVRAADRILIVTPDEQRHELLLTGIDETAVHGKKFVRGERSAHGQTSVEHKEVRILVDQIVAVKTREFSAGKTAVLVGSTYGIFMALAGSMAAGFLAAGP